MKVALSSTRSAKLAALSTVSVPAGATVRSPDPALLMLTNQPLPTAAAAGSVIVPDDPPVHT